MIKLNKITTVAASALVALGLSSCSDWLKVEMGDKIMETTLFSDYEGYVSAMNGVYLTLNDYYTADQSMGVIDAMAQYYNITENDDHKYKSYVSYKYSDLTVESTNSSLWAKGYEIIANNNVVLDHLSKESETPLRHEQFCLLRGEALAMRAMLHFDILRRHGSIYSKEPDAVAIPYQENSKREIFPLLTHREVMDKIFADLNEAAGLLKEVDPILTEGVKNVATEDNGVMDYDMSFRQLRLNYYAVQGLLARAYLWIGDRANAYRVAKNEIIDKITTEQLDVFPWVTKDAVEADKKQDRIFSTEVMFALYNTNRRSLFSNHFASSLQIKNRLTFYGEIAEDSKVARLYGDNDNDYRKSSQWELVQPTQAEIDAAEEAGTEVHTSYFCKKYMDFENAYTAGLDTYRYMVPMLRLSEIYMIAAESTDNIEEAYKFINTVRLHRECPDLPSDGDFDKDLTYEFAKEVLAEGQLFYFYKRRAASRMIDRLGFMDFDMELSNYVWPLPEDEISKRVQVGN